jgi:hypothetical protein
LVVSAPLVPLMDLVFKGTRFQWASSQSFRSPEPAG